MRRFTTPIYVITILLATSAFAQEQVLPSTPIYATFEETPQAQRTAAIVNDFETPIQSTATATSSTYAVGTTPSRSEVSPTGAFTYTVPIAVPPGIQDVQPNIALTYNSQSGNGLAGWGWNISGLSSISRAASTPHHDGVVDGVNFDALDRFALDGQRLILTSGTYGKTGAVYTTENHSNIKITSNGTHPEGRIFGPRSFVVHYPDGSRAYYGYYDEVEIYHYDEDEIINRSSRIEWVITKWEDVQGNQVNYTYDFSEETGGTLRIKNITYGNSTNDQLGEVKFSYKFRNRYERNYVGGSNQLRRRILSHIEVKYKKQQYRKYQLTHHTTSMGYQRVSQIQESNAYGEKRTPVIFSYDSNSTSSQISSLDITTSLNPEINHKATEIVTGNFSEDANLDFVLYNKNRKDLLNIYTGAFDSGTGNKTEVAREVPVPKFEDVISATVINKNGSLDAFQRIVTISETMENHRAKVTFRVFGKATTSKSEKITVDYSKQWIAPHYTNYLCDDLPPFEKTEDLIVKSYTIPKTYFSGDFNGNGLTDVLAISKNYAQKHCEIDGEDCQYIETLSGGYTHKSGDNDEECCTCSHSVIPGGRVYFIDLKRNTTSGFVNSIGSLPNYSSKDRLFVADFDGDGVSDIWHLQDKNISIYSLKNNRLTKIAQRSNDSRIRTYLPTLLGDYNGDGKTDFLIPKEEIGTKSWYLFLSTGNYLISYSYQLPFTFSVNNSKKKYIPQDINQDGKTDIIIHQVGYSVSAPNNTEDYFDPYDAYDDPDEEDATYTYYDTIHLYENFDLGNFKKTVNFNNHETSTEKDPNKIIDNFIPVFTSINGLNKKMQYAILARNHIKRYEISTPHRRNMQMRYVSKGGMRTKIDYAGLDATDYGSIYQSDYGQKYPYININHAPGMELVKQLTKTISGKTRYQQFKYKGAVSHAQGLGFMGFTALARSNTYGDNVSALWNISKHDPQLRGAVTEQWTDPSYSFDQNCYINKTVTSYRTELRPNKVFVNLPKHMVTHNNITQVLHERFFTYDSLLNLETEREKTEGLDKTTTYQYYNNPSPTDANYHIGRPKWEKTVAKVPGAKDFWTETSWNYTNNLLKTEQNRANGSPWVSTTYGYDSFGNPTSKTLATAGLSSRAEYFGYSPNGRDMTWHKNVLGLTTSYEYYPYGALKKETDPYGNSTQYTYDGWNRLHKTTNYLGRVSEVTYAHRSNGGIVKTVNYPNTAPDTRTYYNAWGWTDEKHVQVSNTQWSKTFYKYDAAGRVTQESIPDFYYPKKWNRTYYDLYGRISQVQQATGKLIKTVYDGLRTQVSDGTKTATTTKNALDQIAELADPGGTIQYRYHANGELREADYGGYVVKTEIDPWGRKSKLIDPTAGTFTYTHNAFGEMLEETAPKGKTVFTHDSYGRIKTKTWTGDLTNMVTTYTYNSQTKLLDYEETTDNLNGTTHRIKSEYDDYKRLKKLTESSTYAEFRKTLNYDYYGRIANEQLYAKDKASNKTYNTNAVYGYDLTGAVKNIDNGSRWQALEYNALGQLKRSQMGNGFVQTKTIDAFGFVTAVTDQKGSSANQKALGLSYKFNVKRGLLFSRSDTLLGIHNQQFVYDDMDRLIEAQHDTNNITKTRTRGYDPRGRLTQDSFMGANLTYGSGNDRYKLQGAELNPNGVSYYNQHKDRNITYNADRKPVEVHDVGNGRITFNYSHDGHRQEVWYGGEQEDKTERQYHKTYSRIAPIELLRDLENNTQKFLTYIGGDAYTAPVVHVNDTDSSKPNGYHYLHRDYLGSILAVSNSSGEVIERAHFGAWGDVALFKQNGQDKTLADSLTGRGFTGHEHFTEVGLVHMNGRMYDPQQGRFLSPDNHIQDPFNTQNFNRYGYVLNNPLTLTDPSGEFFWVAVAFGAFFGGAMTAMQGGDFWDILGGALIGGIAAGLGAGLSNLAAQGLGFAGTAAGFFGNAALSVSGFGAGFAVGFAGGFASGFVGATGNALMKGQKFGKSLLMGLKAGLFSGVAAGVTAGITAGIKSAKNGGDFWSRHPRPEVGTVSTLKPQGIQKVGSDIKPQGSLEGLESIELRGTHLEFDGSSLDIIDTFSNDTTIVRDSFSAVSGPYGNGAIPSGEWNTGNVISPTGNVGMSIDGSDFAISLDANFNLNGRSGFYIHPDGNVPGTLGCIGLNGGANRANEFLTTYTNYYNQHGSMRLIVN